MASFSFKLSWLAVRSDCHLLTIQHGVTSSLKSVGLQVGKKIDGAFLSCTCMIRCCYWCAGLESGIVLHKSFGGIPRVPLKKIAMLRMPLEKFSGLQRYCCNFFVSSMPLPSVWPLTPSKCRCEKSKIPLSLNMSLIFLSILTTSNEKTQN